MRPPNAVLRDGTAASRRAVAIMAALLLSIGLFQLSQAADPAAAQDLGTCDVQFHSTESEAGFNHPGIGLTEPVLQNAVDQIAAGAEPWASGFEALKKSSAAGEGVKPSNAGTDPTKPRTTAFNSGTRGMFEADGLKSYTQAVMYVLTGKEVHRQNALNIIRNWEQMDPTKFEYYTDSHIHNGIPLFRMAGAAELLRYTSCGDDGALAWTEADTQAFSDNLIRPAIATFMSSPDRFMNQHNYPLLGSMAGSIFMDDTDLYAEKVEWFTVNESAEDEGFNGSIARLARWVDKNDKTGEPIDDPHVQLVEMGRDQAHGGGNITNFAALSRMMMSQGTTVDPVDGTVSTAEDAVGPYEFLDDRILHAADYFWQFMSGRDPEWTPVGYAISPDGTIRDTYDHIADGYRGRYGTASFWEIYYYYKFTRGEDVEAMAPFFAEAYAKRPGSAFIGWDGHDGGGDSWLFAPAEAAGEANPPLAENPNLLEVEQRYTNLAGDVQDGDGYVSMAGGSKIAYLSGANNKPQQAFRIRTEGAAVMHLGGVSHDDTVKRDTTVTLPDTGGEWRYVTVTRAMDNILFIETEGATVDIDHININAQAELTGPVFPADAADRIIGWAGADLTHDLAATGDGIAYSATGLPEGAELDAATGQLTWNGADSGTITVAADDGTSVAAHTVVLDAAADREDAMALAEEEYEPEDGYESATEAAFTAARDAAEAEREDGTDAAYATALAAMVAAVDGLRLVSPKSDVDGSLDYADLLFASTAKERTPLLIDGDNQSGTGYPQAVNMSHVFDFGADFRVSAREFGFQSNIFADRLANSTVYGSNDGVNWTRITPGATEFTQDFNTLEVAPEFRDDQFRYIKVQMIEQLPDVLYGIIRGVFEMTEFHIYGERHEIDNRIAATSIASDQAIAGKIAVGDTVDVTVKAKSPLSAVTATVAGIPAEASSEDGITWTASVPLEGVAPGTVSLAVDYTDADGGAGPTFSGITDGTALYVGGDRDRQLDIAEIATVTASAKQWPGTGLSAAEVGYLLFDGDGATYGDLNTGTGSYYTIDFGEGAEAHLDEIYCLPRASHPTRANGTVVQGSDDGTTWTDLTAALSGGTSGKWIQRDASGDDHYRYFRIYNAGAWSGNLAEVEFYGDIA